MKKLLGLALTLMIALALLPGCTTLRSIADNIGIPEKAAKAVDRYCEEVPYAERIENRRTVNDLTVKGDITVTCAGDPQ